MKIALGALAHVDAGKTTLSESILFMSQSIRNKGRVDNASTFLDYGTLEKEKGITIFNKEARFTYKDKEYNYIDTPGHSDLSFEANKAISILDAAVLIIAANEDIPADTIRQFSNLLNYNIPILIFINKMDIASKSKDEIISSLKEKLDPTCVFYKDALEELSLSDESLMDYYLEHNTLPHDVVVSSLKDNAFFPVFFGSALKDEGTEELLDYIDEYIETDYNPNGNLNAYIYKVAQDLTYLKVLSGTLANKLTVGNEKINEIYQVSGLNLLPVNNIEAGDIAAVKGLKTLTNGTYIPSLRKDIELKLPSLKYRIISDLDANELYKLISPLNNEQTNLDISLENKEVFIKLNGELHELIIKSEIKERYGIDISFSSPIIRYKETITKESVGVGHFEPLRHYAEVILKTEPSDKQLEVRSNIDNNYTNTLLTYLKTYTMKGILTNSPLTNIRITILDMKTHLKHTEGQDLVEATRRALRHALWQNESQLLEPYYLTTISTTDESQNTVISHLTQQSYLYTIKENSIIVSIPVKQFNKTITALRSKLKGNLSFTIDETIYDKAINPEEVIEDRGYDFRRDYHNPAGSVFCSNGAGHYVEPEDVFANMHLSLSDYVKTETINITPNKSKITEAELERVFNSIYKPKPRLSFNYKKEEAHEYVPKPSKPLIYLIDGYNLMYQLDEDLANEDLINAREKVINIAVDFKGYVNADVVLVFDAYKNTSTRAQVSDYDGITIVYTKQNEIADYYIEKKSRELMDKYKVIVVTSDSLEQLKVSSNGSSVLSSREFIIRYENFQKNNTRYNTKISNRPLESLRYLLEEEE